MLIEFTLHRINVLADLLPGFFDTGVFPLGDLPRQYLVGIFSNPRIKTHNFARRLNDLAVFGNGSRPELCN